MKRPILLLVTLISIHLHSMSQDTLQTINVPYKLKHNAFYAEVAGESILGLTLNYERFFSKKPGGFSARFGFGLGFSPGWNETVSYWAAPVGVSYNFGFGSKTDFLEVGMNYSTLFTSSETAHFINPVIGWRHKSKSDFHARVTLMPLVYVLNENYLGAWAGVSLGFSF